MTGLTKIQLKVILALGNDDVLFKDAISMLSTQIVDEMRTGEHTANTVILNHLCARAVTQSIAIEELRGQLVKLRLEFLADEPKKGK